MIFGTLKFQPVEAALDLIGEPTSQAILAQKLEGILVSQIDPSVSDTEAFCKKYQISAEDGANCVIVEAKRGDNVWYAACMVQGTKRIDVNGVVRRQLGAKKISFALMETAVGLSKMEYGAINPIGLPSNWPILIDKNVAALDQCIIGSGIRSSKLLVSGQLLASLPNATVLDLAKQN